MLRFKQNKDKKDKRADIIADKKANKKIPVISQPKKTKQDPLPRLIFSFPEYHHARMNSCLHQLPPYVDVSGYSYWKLEGLKRQWQYGKNSAVERLRIAASFGIEPLLREELAANPLFINESSVLYSACLYGKLNIVKILVDEYKADVNNVIKGEFPLKGAIAGCCKEIVEFLLARNARLDLEGSFFKETPIQLCQRKMKCSATEKLDTRYLPILALLVAHGADLDSPHLLFNCTPKDYILNMEIDPKLKEEIVKILSQEDPLIDDITKLMEAHKISPDKMDELILSITRLSVEENKEKSRFSMG